MASVVMQSFWPWCGVLSFYRVFWRGSQPPAVRRAIRRCRSVRGQYGLPSDGHAPRAPPPTRTSHDQKYVVNRVLTLLPFMDVSVTPHSQDNAPYWVIYRSVVAQASVLNRSGVAQFLTLAIPSRSPWHFYECRVRHKDRVANRLRQDAHNRAVNGRKNGTLRPTRFYKR